MVEFVLNKPVTQRDPLVKVDVSPTAPLPVGANRFRLVVVDNDGNESQPVFLDVIVKALEAPTAVLDMVDDQQRRIDPVILQGRPFVLSAARSSDVAPGKVVEYRFTLVDPS